MAFKHILVHVDDSEQGRRRLDVALALAESHAAHLTGLYVVDFPSLSAYGAAGLPPDWIEELEHEARAHAAAAETAFGERIAQAGVTTEWRCVEGDTGEVISVNARYADLAVIGQAGEDAAAEARYVPERVVLGTGRPVLIVPYIGPRPTLGENVLVAWNASREATRAVGDALPVLERAKKVTVLAINPEGGPAGHGEVPSADIALWLARHGVTAEAAQAYARDIDAGNALLSRAADLGADLLVMGAYGHSRLREMVLGGATREVLGHMTLPVLMSH